MKNKNGITLIALVITIIVLIILAGVAISLTLGENGILTKAKQAKTDYNLAKEKEELELEIANIQIEIMSQENRTATLNDLYARIDKNKYDIELSFGPVATTANVNTTPTYSIVNKIGSMYYFTVDTKLVITDVETREPKVSYITFGDITWNSGKASITLSTKEQGTIEYKVGEDGVYAPGTTISNLSHGDTVYARINNNGEYTEEETKVIYDGIKPEEFSITSSDLTYNSVKLTTTGTTDNQTGLATYSYVVEKEGNIVQKIADQTEKEYTIDGLDAEIEYVIYMLAYDNAGNVRKSNEVTVKTLHGRINAKIVFQYPSQYLGKTVTNYITGDEYLIFDSDGTNIYLISKNLKELGSAANKYGGTSNTTCAEKLGSQTISADSGIWKSYFGNNALWVQGCPTIQQLASSYKKLYPNKYIEFREGGAGYQVRWSDGSSDWSYSISQIPTNELYTADHSNFYWIASPGSDGSEWVMDFRPKLNCISTGYMTISYYDGFYWGFRPYICLKQDSILTLQSNGTFLID